MKKVKSQKSKAKEPRTIGEMVMDKEKEIYESAHKSLFYFSTSEGSNKITATGLGKDDGSITLSKEFWRLFISSLLYQI